MTDEKQRSGRGGADHRRLARPRAARSPGCSRGGHAADPDRARRRGAATRRDRAARADRGGRRCPATWPTPTTPSGWSSIGLERFGRIDVLVNNASTIGPSPMPALDAYPLDALAEVFCVNVVAPLHLIQLRAAPDARARRGRDRQRHVGRRRPGLSRPGAATAPARRRWSSSRGCWPPSSRAAGCASTSWTPAT